jgi:hypothetical protein
MVATRDKTSTDITYSVVSGTICPDSRIIEEATVPKVRRALLVLAVIFIIYAVINDPTQSANVTSNAWDHIKSALSAIGTFFNTLLSS